MTQGGFIIGVCRHGKTANIDNEGDSQKDETMGLSPDEWLDEKSSLARTAEGLIELGYKTIRLYMPGDTVRNHQSTTLLKDYIKKKSPDTTVIIDTGFQDLHYFHARKQFTGEVYDALLSKSYLEESEKQQILEYKNKKHILGEDRTIRLSETSLQTLQAEDYAMYQKVINGREQSYAGVISNQGTGFEHLKHHIAAHGKHDELHIVCAYRTTVQAAEKTMKHNIDSASIDTFWDIGFAKTALFACNKNGISESSVSINNWDYNPATYAQEISQFEAIYPMINLDNSIAKNRDMINELIYQVEVYLHSYLHLNPNKLNKRFNIINRTLSSDIPDLLGRRIIESILNSYDAKLDQDKQVLQLIQNLIRPYCTKRPSVELFKMLYAYSSLNSQRKDMLGNDPDAYGQLLKPKDGELLTTIRHNRQFKNATIQTLEGLQPLDSLYVPLNLNNQSHTITISSTEAEGLLKNYLITIRAPSGSGKSVVIKKLQETLATSTATALISIDLNHHKEISHNLIQSLGPKGHHGHYTIFLDGLDEKDPDKVKQLFAFISQNQDKYYTFVCASRFIDNSLIQDVKHHVSYGIASIDKKQENEIISKYVQQLVPEQAQKLTQEINRIITKLRQPCTPLLVNTICTLVHEYIVTGEKYELFDNETINRSDLYKEYIALLHERGNKKIVRGDTTSSVQNNQFLSKRFDAMRIHFLRDLTIPIARVGEDKPAFDSNNEIHMNNGYMSYSKNTLQKLCRNRIEHIVNAKSSNIPKQASIAETNPSALADDFIDSIEFYGFLQRDERGLYSFAHKSIQDYFGYLYTQELANDGYLHRTIDRFLSAKSKKAIGPNQHAISVFFTHNPSFFTNYGFDNQNDFIQLIRYCYEKGYANGINSGNYAIYQACMEYFADTKPTFELLQAFSFLHGQERLVMQLTIIKESLYTKPLDSDPRMHIYERSDDDITSEYSEFAHRQHKLSDEYRQYWIRYIDDLIQEIQNPSNPQQTFQDKLKPLRNDLKETHGEDMTHSQHPVYFTGTMGDILGARILEDYDQYDLDESAA